MNDLAHDAARTVRVSIFNSIRLETRDLLPAECGSPDVALPQWNVLSARKSEKGNS